MPPEPSKPRTARAVINEAMRENSRWEKLCFCVVIILVAVGATAMVVGLVKGDWQFAACGTVPVGVVWPCLSFARSIRSHNMAIRMAEVPLSLSKSAKEAADILEAIFAQWREGK